MRQKYIDIAYTKAKRLEKLIEDLFGFTKMNCGKIAMHVGRVDIVKLLGQLLEEFYPALPIRGFTYELTQQCAVPGDHRRWNLLARLFDNLINNAIKYGAEGKKVTGKDRGRGGSGIRFCGKLRLCDPGGRAASDLQ